MAEDDISEFFRDEEERRRFFRKVDEPKVKRERFITAVNVNDRYYKPLRRASGTVIGIRKSKRTSRTQHIVPGVRPTGDDRPTVTSVESASSAQRAAKLGAIVFVVSAVMFLIVLIVKGGLL